MKAHLEKALNTTPDSIQHIHIIGICGTGMAAMAGLLKAQGYTITGSDQNVYPPMSDFLAEAEIPVMDGYAATNLGERPEEYPDLVIVGNVVRPDNPEARGLAERGLPYLSMPQALGHFFLRNKTSLVVAGTHGKTTTSSLLATTLHHCETTPGFMIGGIVEAFGRNFHGYTKDDPKASPYFVVEGDEYDTAFFNKVSKFLHYQPFAAIITSIEFDHADIFPDLEAIKSSFRQFIALLPEDGVLIACGDDPVVKELVADAACTVLLYGSGKEDELDYYLQDIQVTHTETRFTLIRNQKPWGTFALPMPGEHNALNATAVLALLDFLGFGKEQTGPAIAQFEGVKRRQQIRGVVRGITVIDDFAHHPTAVRATLAALRQAWAGHRLIVVFEPRTNTSRRKIFQQDYAKVFVDADLVVIPQHIPLDNVPFDEQFSTATLVQDLEQQKIIAHHADDTQAVLDFLNRECRSGDVIAILSNGGFDNIHQRLLENLGEVQ